MRFERAAQVAIVGGGFSGTMVAAQLARRGIHSALIEKAGRAGEGTAYSTRDPAHLLNVRTGMMSAWPDRPDDFSAWLRRRGEADGGFAKRILFGEYLREALTESVKSGLAQVIEGEAVAAKRVDGRWRVELAGGGTVEAEALVLANGNQPPDALRLAGLTAAQAEALTVSDPWSDEGRARVAAAAAGQVPVLIVGTGLSMVDMVLTLGAAGHDAPITAVSRRGLLPLGHSEVPHPPIDADDAPRGLMPVWRWLRERVAAGDDWRARIDSLRPLSHALWQAMSAAEQRRFLRHARPWWDVHRHRIAPEVAAELAERMGRGMLEVMAGRIRSVAIEGDAARVTIGRRQGGEVEREARLLINCTGPLGALRHTRDPLLRQMLDEGLVAPDPLDIGIDCGPDDAASGAPGLWVLGPLSKARWWEIIAVPDIRGQAERVAEAIEAALR